MGKSTLAPVRHGAWAGSMAGKGRVVGLRPSTTALDVLQVLIEDVVFGVVASVEALEAWAGPQTLVLSGGAAASSAWRQLVADALGRPVVRSRISEASLRGAAIATLGRLGAAVPNPADGDGEIVVPDERRVEALARRRAEAGPPFGASWGR